MESEGSGRQNAGLTNRKHIEADALDKGANRPKVRYLYGNADVDVTGISGKETRITRGGLHVCRKATIAVR